MLAVNRPDGMNDVKRLQLAAGGNYRFAGRQTFRKTRATDLPTLFEDFRSAGTMNCAVNAAAPKQRRVCRVHDRLDILFRDVADDNRDAALEKSLFGFRVQASGCFNRKLK